MTYQWADVLPGDPPASLTDLHCDCWAPRQESDGWVLLCLGIWCTGTMTGWYRRIPAEDADAAAPLREAIDERIDQEDDEDQ